MDQPAVWAFSDAPYAGGAERYLESLLRAAGPSRMGLVAVVRPGLAAWLDQMESLGIVVDRLQPKGTLADWVTLFRWARRRRPRLLHVNLPGPNDGLFALAPLLAKLAGVSRTVVTEHLPSVGRIGRRGLLKRLTTRAVDRAITVCAAHRTVMMREFGYSAEQLVTIPNGILDPGPPAYARATLPSDLALRCPIGRMRIVQVGSLEERKGGLRLLRAFADSGIDASLWFVGEGPQRAELESSASELGIPDRVVFTGRRADLPQLMASFDLVVLASDREGMPYVLIEAMAMARPILATAVDGIPELVWPQENGLLIEADDRIGFARALRELEADPEELLRMGASGRERFEAEFTLEACLAHTWLQYGEEARAWPVSY